MSRRRGALQLGDITLDLDTHALTIGSRRIPLPPSQARLLAVLMEHAPRVVPPELLIARVWPPNEGNMAMLADAIVGVRNVLESEDGEQAVAICYVTGFGYRLEVAARKPSSPPYSPTSY